MALSRTAMIGIVAATVVLGGGLLVMGAGAGSKGKTGGKTVPFAKPKATPAPAGPKVNTGFQPSPADSGISVGLGCSVNIYNLARARATAYSLGRSSKTIEQARADLYKFGPCGVSERLKPTPPQMRNNYLVTYDLLRGAVESKKLHRQEAEALLRDDIFRIALAGVSTADLPVTL